MTIVVVAAWLSLANVVAAQDEPTASDSGIRGSVERILAEPEFRHLPRMVTDDTWDDGRSLKGDLDGDEAADGRKRRRTGTPQKSQKPPGADNDRRPSGRQRDGGPDARRSKPSPKNADGGERDAAPSFDAPSIASPLAQGIGSLMHGVAWIVIAAVAIAIVYLVARAFLDRERTPQTAAETVTTASAQVTEPDRAPGELPPDAYLAEAQRLAAEGRFREAIAQLLLGAMSDIERQGLIRYRRGLTLRDYLRAVAGQMARHDPLREIVRTYEPIGFGRRDATRFHYDSVLLGYEALSRATT